jgi:hypothetical protein
MCRWDVAAVLSLSALLTGVDAGDRGIARLLPDHEERLLGITSRTSFPRSVVEQLNDWPDSLRAAWRPPGTGVLTR